MREKFYHRFTLPDSTDADKIETKSKYGALTIPKQEVAASRRIKVNIKGI